MPIVFFRFQETSHIESLLESQWGFIALGTLTLNDLTFDRP